MTVAVPFSADPNQVLEAFRRIQEEARRTGRELKSLGDINFPGLEDAKKILEDANRGLEQMFSPAVRGRAAESLRSGAKAGMYDRDIVSVLGNAQRQFPDERALNNHINAVVQQATRIAALSGGMSGGGEEAQGGGGGMMGFAGMLPAARAILPLLGVGATAGFAAKKVGDATDEAIGMSALRRIIGGTNLEFEEFRDHIRKAGAGMALNTKETLALANAYAKASGALGADKVEFGAHEGARLARERGLDPNWGASAMGRASWLGMGKDETTSFRKLAEIMAGSNLGAKQGEAAEALLRFTERSNLFMSGGGNTEGFAAKYLALINSGQPGIKTNAEGILTGFDSAVRNGGMAGDAGKNLMWSALSQHGITNPFMMQRYQQMGFTGMLPDNTMIGDVLHKFIKGMGGDKDMQAARMSGFFGGNMDITAKALEAMEKYQADPNQMKAEIDRLEEEQRKSDPGYKAAETAADLERQLTIAMQGLVEPITLLKKAVVELTEGVNTIIGFLPNASTNPPPPVFDGDVGKTAAHLQAFNKSPLRAAGIGRYGLMAGSPGYHMIQDEPFMNLVDSMRTKYGVTLNSTKIDKSGVDHFYVTSRNEKSGEEFAKAVTVLADAIHQGIAVHVDVDKGTATVKAGKGRIGYPSSR
jgi:hypothetical protein